VTALTFIEALEHGDRRGRHDVGGIRIARRHPHAAHQHLKAKDRRHFARIYEIHVAADPQPHVERPLDVATSPRNRSVMMRRAMAAGPGSAT
jgi:hypothetical protein